MKKTVIDNFNHSQNFGKGTIALKKKGYYRCLFEKNPFEMKEFFNMNTFKKRHGKIEELIEDNPLMKECIDSFNEKSISQMDDFPLPSFV